MTIRELGSGRQWRHRASSNVPRKRDGPEYSALIRNRNPCCLWGRCQKVSGGGHGPGSCGGDGDGGDDGAVIVTAMGMIGGAIVMAVVAVALLVVLLVLW